MAQRRHAMRGRIQNRVTGDAMSRKRPVTKVNSTTAGARMTNRRLDTVERVHRLPHAMDGLRVSGGAKSGERP
jgi:hypothetical protein